MAVNGFSSTSTTTTHNSTQFFSRRQFCTIDSTNCCFPSITMFGATLQFRRYSSCRTRSFSSPVKGLLAPDRANPSKSSARFVQLREITSTHPHEQMIPERHGDIGSPSATTTRFLRGAAAWAKEGDDVRRERSTHKISGIQSWHGDIGSAYSSENHKRILNKIETPLTKFPTSLKSRDLAVEKSLNRAALLKKMEPSGQEDGTAYEKSRHSESRSLRTTLIPSIPEDKVLGNANGNTIKTEGSSISVKNRNTVLNGKDLNGTKYAIEKEAALQNDGSFTKFPNSLKSTNKIEVLAPNEAALQNDGSFTKFPNSLKSTNKIEVLAPNGAAVADVNDIKSGVTKTKVIPLNHDIRKMLTDKIYGLVLVVDSISVAKEVVKKLTVEYRHLVYGCDTEVAKIDVKLESPVDHGEIICFSIYGGPNVDFGNGMSCIWVDVLDGGGKDILLEFASFFDDPAIKKVWHNYSFDNHIVENYGIKLCGFHADTMHMARLWDSSRRTQGGYSLEALSGNKRLMSKSSWQSGSQLDDAGRSRKTSKPFEDNLIGKVSMKTIFGRKKLKKDGSEGKVVIIPPVEELQREEREPWICYSALDSINTLRLYESLKTELKMKEWICDEITKGNMFDFYETHWRPFGELLVKMEMEGMLVDRAYLADIQKVATAEQQVAVNRFRNWASSYCPQAKDMNVGSDTQLRQLFYGGIENRNNPGEWLPETKSFKIPNVDKVIEPGKKVATKFRNLTLKRITANVPAEIYTASGWPSMSGVALKTLAGKVSAEYDIVDDADLQQDDEMIDHDEETSLDTEARVTTANEDIDTSDYGTAYAAFGKGLKGKEACHAIAALCQVCSIDTLLSNFILPLQGSHISGKNGRIHCSLNINTETGRLSARRPNLQNQPALEKDRYKIRQAFIAAPGNSLIVADYGQLELRILAHLADCKSMLDAFKAGGDFHSRTAMNMYPHIRTAVNEGRVLLEWDPQPGEDKPPVPLLKDAFASERRKAKMLNFSIAYGKTPVGLSRDWKVSVSEARKTVKLWYKERQEVMQWQEIQKEKARTEHCVHTLLGRSRLFPSLDHATPSLKGHIERAAINTPVQGSAADVAMCAMIEISKNEWLKELGWKLLLQVHDEVILEGPTETGEIAKAIVVECMANPFDGKNILNVDLSVDAKCAKNWYAAK